MKQIIKKLGKKTALVMMSAVIAGTGATMAAFAAIPHSTTGVISGCYATSDGAVRVIDAQDSETCEPGETALNWNVAGAGSQTSAVLHLDPDPNDNTTYVMDAARSRNVLDVKTLDLEGNKYLCIKVAFRPEIKLVNPDMEMVGGGVPIDLKIPAPGSDFAIGLESLCGEGYNIVTFLTTAQVSAQSILFYR